MKKYENLDNARDRIHTIEITLQLGEYKGTLKQEIGGNCFGQDILRSFDADEISTDEVFKENNCNLVIGEDDEGKYWFTCILKNDKGEETKVEDYADALKNLVVKIEIVDCKIKE